MIFDRNIPKYKWVHNDPKDAPQMSTKLNWSPKVPNCPPDYPDFRELCADEGMLEVRVTWCGSFGAHIRRAWNSKTNSSGHPSFYIGQTGFTSGDQAMAWVESRIEFARSEIPAFVARYNATFK